MDEYKRLGIGSMPQQQLPCCSLLFNPVGNMRKLPVSRNMSDGESAQNRSVPFYYYCAVRSAAVESMGAIKKKKNSVLLFNRDKTLRLKSGIIMSPVVMSD
ncbi:hypothetical protein DAPPUDRAFT_249239 [Daphnia pulex]|uniref:Uncharacterized protein n=1 Tax=Daphnia pulex TaxID=6669 RepID=E9GW80_DAPPU|nr:hypothetical protein DAPPUDRAFT_249239 [Daphnia pulex]|eukprot:EFX76316.1 hypothetical protein DAPPUDRAFT_249239 [Daphnia pulex]